MIPEPLSVWCARGAEHIVATILGADENFTHIYSEHTFVGGWQTYVTESFVRAWRPIDVD